MLGSHLCFFLYVAFFCFFVPNFPNIFASPTLHSCHPDQKNALLDFKNEFQIQNYVFADLFHNLGINATFYAKTKSWKNDGDCCSWDGVTCDVESGVVIGLDLSFSCFYGNFKPNSSLFKLNHLRNLNLAYNNFAMSSIPSKFGKLTSLMRLNLSSSMFSGRIPIELLQLTKLVSLDLTTFLPYPRLFTDKPFLSTLARNLTNLRELHLTNVNISSTISEDFVNLSSLRSLHLDISNVFGVFPSGIFQLPHIESIRLSQNPNLTGSLPKFRANSSLTVLDLSFTGFSGNLPHTISNLRSLKSLVLDSSNFSGSLPDSIGNLTSLNFLDLGFNNFSGEVPSSIGSLYQLSYFRLSHNKLSGNFPLVLHNLTELVFLDLSDNQFTGPLPSNNITRLSKLQSFVMGGNSFGGSVPLSLFTMSSLTEIDLHGNQLRGPLEFKNLASSSMLSTLDLSDNKIKAQVPKWLWTRPNLDSVNLSHNSFSSFEGSPKFLHATKIRTLDLSSNTFQGPFTVPPLSTRYVFASRNNFIGKIPWSICKLNSLEVIDLSNNNFSGSIPRCLGNFSDSLSVLNLRSNSLSGSLPETFTNGCNLRTLDVGHNRLAEKLPKSLINCTSLEVLNVQRNRINDEFPFWLGALPELQVLVLRSNRFHGLMSPPEVSSGFSKLRIIDISYNKFTGNLPSDYFTHWSAMASINTNENQTEAEYMGDTYYQDSIVLRNKGLEMELVRILTIYTAIDFSGNRFQGHIPESIRLLKDLIVLNLSNNAFTGHIPPSLANLTELESLDLSRNLLSGNIPVVLGDLSFLAYINVSHNQLVGPIPEGTQFQRQPNSSFEGNLGLCGPPLQKTCGDVNTPTSQQPQPSELEEEIWNWRAVAIGYAPGIVFGLTMGHIVTSYKRKWFMKILGRNKLRA